ncbi:MULTISPECIES: helix-turn-helix domain-containing protein [Micrococcaceae]|uniref:helix-turn-helix domain-containing protein n=1 Tax=Micrococcaceae TaxID=1268 RepID=UPI0021536D6E|nr:MULTISPECIES: helix-turn-helix transcriptional regulator [Micrococcaceae]
MSAPDSDYTPAALAVLRSQLGLSIKDLAGVAGVSERRAHAWLAGTGHPSPAAVARLDTAHRTFQQQLRERLAVLLRSRTRPVVLSVAGEHEVAQVAALAVVLELRGIPYRIEDTTTG